MTKDELLDLLEKKDYIEIKKRLPTMNEVNIAEILNDLDLSIAVLVFRMLPKDMAVEVFARFDKDKKEEIIDSITDIELAGIVEELFFDDMVDMIEEMPANIVNKILHHSSPDERRLINMFLRYPEESAGSIMTIEYVELRKEMTVGESLKRIKEIGLTKETVYTCYVTNNNRVLEGIVSLRKLVTSDEDVIIKDIMDEDVVCVNTHDDREVVADIFLKYGFIAIPVVDNEHRLTGIITVDDIMNVMESEATEDFQKMAAMAPSDDAYLDSSVFSLAKQRFTWLLILMVGATLTSGIIGRYEDVLSKMVVLTAFIPMLMDTGGNSGSQSSTLVIRGIATGDIEWKDKWKVLWKEFRISFIVGLGLGVVNFAKNMLVDKVGLVVSITVSVTLWATVMMSKMLGGLLPLLAKKVNLDPAIMAGPLITTIVDSLALIVYFTIATLFLNIA
ncbi:MAG TPA: magnesium transporter [Tissierellaceae bacterium]